MQKYSIPYSWIWVGKCITIKYNVLSLKCNVLISLFLLYLNWMEKFQCFLKSTEPVMKMSSNALTYCKLIHRKKTLELLAKFVTTFCLCWKKIWTWFSGHGNCSHESVKEKNEISFSKKIYIINWFFLAG